MKIITGIKVFEKGDIVEISQKLGVPQKVIDCFVHHSDDSVCVLNYPITLDKFQDGMTSETVYRYTPVINKENGDILLHYSVHSRGNRSSEWGAWGIEDKPKKIEDIPELLERGYFWNYKLFF